ncbi:hypothetical protein B296_00010373 [Ensete ventricosum]|uniref:Cupin type-1 domain-containing protein n=1 Tax=Ensete ventricosum TaxID=4639 RepID=A0A426ZX03_ENSVE|nr:hypothetical protein B296_00010373 [Ensete ventricosum]
MKIRQNVGGLMTASVRTPERITTLDGRKLPTPRFVQMSAVRGLLHPVRRKETLSMYDLLNMMMMSPSVQNANAHSILYVVGRRGLTGFGGELRQGQPLVVPQYFAVTTQAQHESLDWISIKTNDNGISQPLRHAGGGAKVDPPLFIPKHKRGEECIKELKVVCCMRRRSLSSYNFTKKQVRSCGVKSNVDRPTSRFVIVNAALKDEKFVQKEVLLVVVELYVMQRTSNC